MLENEFIKYEQALALKELGFDEPCFGHYLMKKFYLKEYHKQGDGITLRPLYQQAFRWFRKEHKIHGEVNIRTYFIYDISNDEFEMIKQYDKLTNTYEEAELACLKKLIEIVKNK